MSGWGIVDFSSEDSGRRDEDRSLLRRLLRPYRLFLIVVLVGVPLLAGWIHLGRVHESDLMAFDRLTDRMSLLDRDAPPLLHGSSPPCEVADGAGVITRSYSNRTGPTPDELRQTLDHLGFSLAGTSAGAVFTLVDTVDGHEVRVDLAGPGANERGVSLRATISASALACRLR